MILSILIPTIYERHNEFVKLEQWIDQQLKKLFPDEPGASIIHGELPVSGFTYNNMVEVWNYPDNKEISIGEKRMRLYSAATGKYSWMIDDDDIISIDAIEKILKAIRLFPDCVTFKEHCTIEGVFYTSNHSLKYDDWEGNGNDVLEDGFKYHRTPFFKSVIRTDLCRQVGVADMRFGEDHDFARRIKPLLKTEVHIDDWIYFYQHNSTAHNERYGIK